MLALIIGLRYFVKIKTQFNEVEKFIDSIQNRYDDKIVTEIKLNDKFYNSKIITLIIMQITRMHHTARLL